MELAIVASTRFHEEAATGLIGYQWEPSSEHHGSNLAEYAGRMCYGSWNKPNPMTAENDGYLANIIDHQHFNVMEHATASIGIVGVSRAMSHEGVRHRHHSYSQLSQRFDAQNFTVSHDAPDDATPFVIPPLFEANEDAQRILARVWEAVQEGYTELVEIGDQEMHARGYTKGRDRRKGAREAARAILPNMTPTNFIVTANHRAWRHFCEIRGSIHADREIRAVAVAIFKLLEELEPAMYQDMAVFDYPILDENKNARHYERVVMKAIDWEALEF